ncbi:MAG: DUF2520 domain-containing protein [Butyrivibrio sp.]|nr:DUF2520 domain-containing protein [Butyrivibrio sp.]
MNIGFIGAGKVGCSLGKYLTFNQHFLSGYYSRNPESSASAANYTGSRQFLDLSELISSSDIIFVTVPDGAIASVWDEIVRFDISGKIICHCSGALSSSVFSGIRDHSAYGFSVHPFLAISGKFDSYQDISKAFFTIEGSAEKIQEVCKLISDMGNSYQIIQADVKTKYHAAAVFASNLMIGVMDGAAQLLKECGFTDEQAEKALIPIISGNIQNAIEKGTTKALTGPVERCDTGTVKGHISALEDSDLKNLYVEASKQLIKVALRKHPDRDYEELKNFLEICD